jgi:hypothetical protein
MTSISVNNVAARGVELPGAAECESDANKSVSECMVNENVRS